MKVPSPTAFPPSRHPPFHTWSRAYDISSTSATRTSNSAPNLSRRLFHQISSSIIARQTPFTGRKTISGSSNSCELALGRKARPSRQARSVAPDSASVSDSLPLPPGFQLKRPIIAPPSLVPGVRRVRCPVVFQSSVGSPRLSLACRRHRSLFFLPPQARAGKDKRAGLDALPVLRQTITRPLIPI